MADDGSIWHDGELHEADDVSRLRIKVVTRDFDLVLLIDQKDEVFILV